jgi:hypothetical protein
MFCPNCGFDNPNGTFCGKCGTQLPIQAAPVPQQPMPKGKGKKTLIVAVVAVVIVVAVILAAVLVVLPKATAQSSPQATLNSYLDGSKEQDAAKVVDSTILHFNSTYRSMFISGFANQTITSSMINITVVSMEDIPMAGVPKNITLDVTNFTNAIQSHFGIVVQGSQFVKVTIKQTNSSTDSATATTYLLLSQVDGKWYFDIFVAYSVEDWAADQSISDGGWGLFS